jgi:hypothetical protein
LRKNVLKRPLHNSAHFIFLAGCIEGGNNLLFPISRHNPGTLDCERFAGACLAVRKDSPIVALQTTVSNRLSDLQEDFFLGRVLVCDIVKCECFDIHSAIQSYFGLLVHREA